MKRNVAAALLGKFIPAVLTVGVMPTIAFALGMEAFGLIAFYTVLQTVFSVLDFGATQTFTREISRLRAQPSGTSLHVLTSTLELLLLPVVALVVATFVLVPDLVVDWVHIERLEPAAAREAVGYMGLALGLNYFLVIYQGGLYGLERIGSAASISCLGAILRTVGSVVIVEYVANSVVTYFVWISFSNLLLAVMMRQMLWRALGPAEACARFDKKVVLKLWRFGLAVALLNLGSVAATQFDRLFVSRMMSLEALGYYALALQLAAIPTLLVVPIKDVLFPRLASIAAREEGRELSDTYHRATRFTLTLVLPVAGLLMWFPTEVVSFWTREPAITAVVAPLVSTLAIGFTFTSVALLPYVLQLAIGWVSLQLKLIALLLVMLIPLLTLMISRLGLIGAAISITVLNGAHFFMSVEFMHRRVLRSEKRSWYVHDIVRGALAALVPIALAAALPAAYRPVPDILYVAIAGVLSFTAICAALGLLDGLRSRTAASPLLQDTK